jgi:hypothetical protein
VVGNQNGIAAIRPITRVTLRRIQRELWAIVLRTLIRAEVGRRHGCISGHDNQAHLATYSAVHRFGGRANPLESSRDFSSFSPLVGSNRDSALESKDGQRIDFGTQ